MSVQRENILPIQVALLQGAGNDRILLKTSLVRIGRAVSGDTDIMVNSEDKLVSREHARLILEMGRWQLEDCSRNGTVVNGEPIHGQRVALRTGDRIQIGHTFDYVFRDLNVTDAAPIGEQVPLAAHPATNTHETP
ncbi:MAG TPA: FHA domain-containing protein, partial [Anaerolineae bacterium]